VEDLLGKHPAKLVSGGQEFPKARRSDDGKAGEPAVPRDTLVNGRRRMEKAIFDFTVEGQAGAPQGFGGLPQDGLRSRFATEDGPNPVREALGVDGRPDEFIATGGYGEGGHEEQYFWL